MDVDKLLLQSEWLKICKFAISHHAPLTQDPGYRLSSDAIEGRPGQGTQGSIRSDLAQATQGTPRLLADRQANDLPLSRENARRATSRVSKLSPAGSVLYAQYSNGTLSNDLNAVKTNYDTATCTMNSATHRSMCPGRSSAWGSSTHFEFTGTTFDAASKFCL